MCLQEGTAFFEPPPKKGIYDLTEHLVSILILVGWEFLRKSDYKYPMLILLKIAFSVSHSEAFRDLLMVSPVIRGARRQKVGLAPSRVIGERTALVWSGFFSDILSLEQL